jgi:hypothetical protein
VAPVNHQAGTLKLAPEVVDVSGNEVGGMRADLQREILRVNAECIEADRLEDGVPLESLESSVNVVPREREEVADVQPLCRRVREHHQCVERAHAGSEVGVVRPPRLPAFLPFPLDRGRLIAAGFSGQRHFIRLCHRIAEFSVR